MKTTARDVMAAQVRPCPMLEACRLGEKEAGDDARRLPEPWWVRPSDEGLCGLWYPRGQPRSDSVPAVIVTELEDPPRLLTLRLIARHGDLSPLETGRLLDYLHARGYTVEELARRAAGPLGLPAAKVWVETYRRFPDLPDPVRGRLHREELDPRLIRYLLDVPDRLREPLWDALGEGRIDLTVQQARRLSEALRRLPRARDADWEERRSVRSDEEPRETGERWLGEARRLAFPETDRRERAFYRDLKALDLDGRIRVDPPDRFEGDYLDFHLRCHRDQNLSDLAEALKSCQPLLEHV